MKEPARALGPGKVETTSPACLSSGRSIGGTESRAGQRPRLQPRARPRHRGSGAWGEGASCLPVGSTLLREGGVPGRPGEGASCGVAPRAETVSRGAREGGPWRGAPQHAGQVRPGSPGPGGPGGGDRGSHGGRGSRSQGPPPKGPDPPHSPCPSSDRCPGPAPSAKTSSPPGPGWGRERQAGAAGWGGRGTRGPLAPPPPPTPALGKGGTRAQKPDAVDAGVRAPRARRGQGAAAAAEDP